MNSAKTLSVLIAASGLLAFGCSNQPAVSRTYGNVGWNAETEEKTVTDELVPGIDQAMIRWYSRGDDLVYAVWTDLPGGGGTSGGSSGNSNLSRERHETSVELSDGSRFQFEYVLDRKDRTATGDLIIADLTFDTRLGGLMLVSTQGGTTVVKQLEVPSTVAAILQAEGNTQESLRNALLDFARKETELNAFFANKGM